MAVLGYGQTTLVAKIITYVHILKIMSGGGFAFTRMRYRVRGVCSDQGTERLLCDAPYCEDVDALKSHLAQVEAGVVSLPASIDSFLLPVALWVPGHIHMVWNAVQEALESMPLWTSFYKRLQGIVDFVRSKGLRQRFQALCLGQSHQARWQALFNHFSAKPIDWRWEKLMTTLDALAPLLPLIQRYYSYEVMQHGIQNEDHVDKACLKTVRDFVADQDAPAFIVVVLAVRDILDESGHIVAWLESCDCHDASALPGFLVRDTPYTNWGAKTGYR